MDDSDNFEPEDEESACELIPLHETMLPYRAHIGAMLSVNERIVEVVMVRPSTITSLDIEMYGDHLREHEGSIGTIISYIESDRRPAGPTPDRRPAGPTPDHVPAGPTSPGAPPSSPGAPPSSPGAPPSSPGAPPSSPGAPPSSPGAPPSSPGAPPSSPGAPPEWGILECQERHIDPVASREEAEQLVAAYNQASMGAGIRCAIKFLVVRHRRIPRPEHLQDLGGTYWEVMPSPSPRLLEPPPPEYDSPA